MWVLLIGGIWVSNWNLTKILDPCLKSFASNLSPAETKRDALESFQFSVQAWRLNFDWRRCKLCWFFSGFNRIMVFVFLFLFYFCFKDHHDTRVTSSRNEHYEDKKAFLLAHSQQKHQITRTHKFQQASWTVVLFGAFPLKARGQFLKHLTLQAFASHPSQLLICSENLWRVDFDLPVLAKPLSNFFLRNSEGTADLASTRKSLRKWLLYLSFINLKWDTRRDLQHTHDTFRCIRYTITVV